MKNKPVKYPIGDQDFKSIREDGFVYVDKTEYIEKILDGNKYYFLARPRCFGKSLFLSTLKFFFEGQRDLFKGLYIDSIAWNWEPWPVLHLDLKGKNYNQSGMLETGLDKSFCEWEARYGILDTSSRLFSIRFRNIIETAHKCTGKQVVILINEYDKPMADNVNDENAFRHCYSLLGGMYGNLKSCAEHIRLVFLTGTYQPWQLGDLHELNHLHDISDTDDYAGICGFTEKDIAAYLSNGIEYFAAHNGISREEVLLALKDRYDGYRFSSEDEVVYNPYSILNALKYSKIRNYWNETGMPQDVKTFLSNMDGSYMEDFEGVFSDLSFHLHAPNSAPDGEGLLYLNGYLTIKDYDFHRNEFILCIPNKEVKDAITSVIGEVDLKSS